MAENRNRVIREGEEEQAKLEALAAEGKVLDPLQALLLVDPDKAIVGTFKLQRLGVDITYKAPGDEYEDLIEQCTTVKQVKRTHQRVRDVDTKKLAKLIVFNYVTVPDLRDPRLQKHYGVNAAVPEDIVDRVFLPGERDRLQDAILTLGGYTDEIIDEVKD